MQKVRQCAHHAHGGERRNTETLADWIIVALCALVLCVFFFNGGL